MRNSLSGTIFNYHILIWPNFIWFIKWFIIKSDLSDLSDLSSDLSDLIEISDLFLNLYTRILKFQIAKIGQIEIIEGKKIKKSKMEIRNSLVSSFLSKYLVIEYNRKDYLPGDSGFSSNPNSINFFIYHNTIDISIPVVPMWYKLKYDMIWYSNITRYSNMRRGEGKNSLKTQILLLLLFFTKVNYLYRREFLSVGGLY